MDYKQNNDLFFFNFKLVRVCLVIDFFIKLKLNIFFKIYNYGV